MEAVRQNSDGGVPENYLVDEFPEELLRKTLGMLPKSHLFVAPVNRKFRDLYREATADEKKKHATCMYSISSEAALEQYLEGRGRQQITFGRITGDSPSSRTSRIGAGAGRMEWLERGGVFDARTCAAAAAGGQLRVLEWLRARGCPWDIETCSGAASGGQLRTLRWLREEGCPWQEWTCMEAARGGHLAVLRWARGEGCPWNKGTCRGAALHGQLEILRWVLEQGCPFEEDSIRLHVFDPDFIAWFEEHVSNQPHPSNWYDSDFSNSDYSKSGDY